MAIAYPNNQLERPELIIGSREHEVRELFNQSVAEAFPVLENLRALQKTIDGVMPYDDPILPGMSCGISPYYMVKTGDPIAVGVWRIELSKGDDKEVYMLHTFFGSDPMLDCSADNEPGKAEPATLEQVEKITYLLTTIHKTGVETPEKPKKRQGFFRGLGKRALGRPQVR